MMYGRGVRGAAALGGVDWRGEPAPRRDGSLVSVSQATALSGDGESSVRKRQDRTRESELKAWEPAKDKASFSQLLTLVVLL